MIEVLLVDDESYVTESLKATIPWEDLGVISVYQAESAREALELLERHQIDILVTDIQMPEMSGLKLKGSGAWISEGVIVTKALVADFFSSQR